MRNAEQQPRVFPPDFQWGTGSAAYHVEGNKSGERHIDFDAFLDTHPEKTTLVTSDEKGPDWWSEDQFQEDIDQIANLGLGFLRISLEQGRLQPDGIAIDKDVLGKYRRMVNYIQQKGLDPQITVNHFTLPEWIGGWHKDEVHAPMKRYTEVIASEFGDVKTWFSINEPTIEVMEGYINGNYPPGIVFGFGKAYQAWTNMQEANDYIYETIKKKIPDAQVGPTYSITSFEPKSPASRMDRFAAGVADSVFNQTSLKRFSQTADFIGTDYYTGFDIEFNRRSLLKFTSEGLVPKEIAGAVFHAPEGEFKADVGWSTAPVGFLKTMQRVHEVTGLPQLITESGISDKRDTVRPYFMASHLLALHEAVTYHDIPVIGYTHMAAIDNVDWLNGMTMHYGLLGVDENTYERTMRESAKAYAETVRTNQLDFGPYEYLMTEGQAVQLHKNEETMQAMRPQSK